MSYFVVSVQPRREAHFLRAVEKLNTGSRSELAGASFFWPRRQLTIRRRGKRLETLAPIFPGYIFVETGSVTRELFSVVKELPGFYRFLESNERIRPLEGRDREIVAHFARFGGIIGKSQVTLDENQRIRVIHGPLEGLEGLIVRIDKRKQRAKVRLDLYQESFLVDFGFELLAGKGDDSRRTRGKP
jgi:transcriptional antiterminator NusG